METKSIFVKPDWDLSNYLEELFRNGKLAYQQKIFYTGEHLFKEGEIDAHTYYIIRGLFRVYSSNREGCTKTLFFHKAKTLIGFQGLRKDRPELTLNSVACTPGEVYQISSVDFISLMKSDSKLCFLITQYLFSIMSVMTVEAVNVSFYSIPQRLSALLLELANEHGSSELPVFIPYRYQELSEMLGVHRNSINNAIATLKKAGIIEMTDNGFVIVNCNKLKNIARGMFLEKKP